MTPARSPESKLTEVVSESKATYLLAEEPKDPDLAEALQLLDRLATWCPCADNGEQCANTEAHALLVRHGIRKEPSP